MTKNHSLSIVFIIADASIETIPDALINDPTIKKHAYKKGKKPGRIILDSTYHYRAIQRSNISMKEKRGRPDIVHRALLLMLDSLLIQTAPITVSIYIHTLSNKIIWISPKTRLPRHYDRFIGLMENLFAEKFISEPHRNIPLLKILPLSLRDLISKYDPCLRIGFSRRGKLLENLEKYLRKLISKCLKTRKKAILNFIGGFPSGFFSKLVQEQIDELIAISKIPLSTSYTLCKIINAYEKILINL